MRHRPYTERFGAPISTPRESRSAADYACSIERAAPMRHIGRRVSFALGTLVVGAVLAMLLSGCSRASTQDVRVLAAGGGLVQEVTTQSGTHCVALATSTGASIVCDFSRSKP